MLQGNAACSYSDPTLTVLMLPISVTMVIIESESHRNIISTCSNYTCNCDPSIYPW